MKKRNIAVDMISAALAHYKNYPHLKIKSISLSKLYWVVFKDFMQQAAPEVKIEDAVMFNELIIEKGSMFQLKHLVVHLDTPKIEA